MHISNFQYVLNGENYRQSQAAFREAIQVCNHNEMGFLQEIYNKIENKFLWYILGEKTLTELPTLTKSYSRVG